MADTAHAEGPVTITGLSVDGEGIGRLADGRVVFVDRTLPGDVAQVRPVRLKKRVVQGELVALTTPSAGRVQSQCDIWACGGCPLREASPALAQQQKRLRIIHCMERLGGVDMAPLAVPMTGFGDGWRYRHRVRLHAAWHTGGSEADGRWVLGYHQRHSRALVPFSTCPVLWPELERLARALLGGVAQLPKSAQIDSVALAYGRRDGRGTARIVTHGPMAAMRQSLKWLEGSELSGLHIEAADGQFRWGNLALNYDHQEAHAFDLSYEPGLFTQAHVQGNDALVAHVLEQVGPRPQLRVLELHAGVGNFSVPMARRGARVTAVEQLRRAAIVLERNARSAGVDVQVHAESDAWAIKLLRDRPDVLVMDPARAGAAAVAEAIGALGPGAPRKIVYVSCDPATLARDTRAILRSGLRLSQLAGFDNFPQTPHVEAVATFVR